MDWLGRPKAQAMLTTPFFTPLIPGLTSIGNCRGQVKVLLKLACYHPIGWKKPSTFNSFFFKGLSRLLIVHRSSGGSDWRGRQRICHLQVGEQQLARLANYIHCISPGIRRGNDLQEFSSYQYKGIFQHGPKNELLIPFIITMQKKTHTPPCCRSLMNTLCEMHSVKAIPCTQYCWGPNLVEKSAWGRPIPKIIPKSNQITWRIRTMSKF